MTQATGTFLSGEVKLFYRLFGSQGAMPIVIVHGLSYFSYDWIPVATALSSNRQVAALDMRGFGQSEWPGQYAVQQFASDIVSLADHLGWPEVALIGHSMGGRNACVCTAQNSGRVKALVLVDWSPEPAKEGTRRIAQTVASVPDCFESVEEAMRFFGSNDRARFEAYLQPVPGGFAIRRDPYFRDQFRKQLQTGERSGHGIDLWAALSSVSCSILLVRGARSDLLTREAAEKMRSTSEKLALVELGTGHNVAGEAPEAFSNAVRQFLSNEGI
jgi:esterase